MKSENRTDIRRAAKAVAVGTVSGVFVSMLLIFVSVAVLLKMEKVPYGTVSAFTAVSSGIGALFGGYICGRTGKRLGMVLGAVCGALAAAVLVLIGIISGGTVGSGALLRLLITVVGGALGGIAGVNKRRRRK